MTPVAEFVVLAMGCLILSGAAIALSVALGLYKEAKKIK